MDCMNRLYAGVELGGTKCIALLTRGTDILDKAAWPTTTPDDVLAKLADYLRHHAQHVDALGIASFGPLDLNPASRHFGYITSTPKPGWSMVDVRSPLAAALPCPTGFDTDVNAAGLAEGRGGAAQGCSVHAYVTIGTGLGGGLIVGGRPVHGLIHPEIGHMRIRRVPGDDFGGVCPYHGDCLEGLVSGPALAARFGQDPAQVPDGHPLWAAVAHDLAEFMANLLLTVSPERIVIGGGVAVARPALLANVHRLTADCLSGYLHGITGERLAEIIVPAALGVNAGPLGAIALAMDAV